MPLLELNQPVRMWDINADSWISVRCIPLVCLWFHQTEPIKSVEFFLSSSEWQKHFYTKLAKNLFREVSSDPSCFWGNYLFHCFTVIKFLKNICTFKIATGPYEIKFFYICFYFFLLKKHIYCMNRVRGAQTISMNSTPELIRITCIWNILVNHFSQRADSENSFSTSALKILFSSI